MKLTLDSTAGRNLFTGYGDGYVDVNGARHHENVFVGETQVTPAWFSGTLDALSAEHLEPIAAAKPEIVVLGCGAAFRFPRPEVLAPMYRAGIGVEVMDTKAACRTYNILLSEGRRVVAALIVE
jgi:uncharacterized protein